MNVCIHGQLARSCSICELIAENVDLKARLAGTFRQVDLLELLKDKDAQIERLFADRGRSMSMKKGCCDECSCGCPIGYEAEKEIVRLKAERDHFAKEASECFHCIELEARTEKAEAMAGRLAEAVNTWRKLDLGKTTKRQQLDCDLALCDAHDAYEQAKGEAGK